MKTGEIGPLRRVAVAAPFLLALFGFLLRSINIGALPPYLDEAANILTGVDEWTRRIVAAEGQGRPLLNWLFKPALWFGSLCQGEWPLVAAARTFVNLSVCLTSLILITVAQKRSGIVSALAVAIIWTLAPLSFLHGRLALQDPFTALFLAIVCAYIALRPYRSDQREGKAEVALLLCAGIAANLAILNKITAVLEFPWLLIWYWFEQRRRGEQFLEGHLTRMLASVFALTAVVLLLWLLTSSHERLTALGHLSNHSLSALSFQGIFEGFTPIRNHLLEYFGPLFSVVFLCSLLLAPIVSPKTAPLVLGFVATLFLYALSFRGGFPARYFFSALIPLSFIVGECAQGLAGICSLQKPWLKRAWRTWQACITFTILGWGWSISTVLTNPIQNFFSSSIPTQRRDYEIYTNSFWSGRGIDEIHHFIRNRLQESPNKQIAIIGPTEFSPIVYNLRLQTLNEPRLMIVPALVTRWDFPFHALSLQQQLLGRTEQPELLLIRAILCDEDHPAPCMSVDSPSPGIEHTLLKETAQNDPKIDRRFRFQIFQLLPTPLQKLGKVVPPSNGIYPDGLIAPVTLLEVPSATGGQRKAQRLTLTGKLLKDTPLDSKEIQLSTQDSPLPFVFSTIDRDFRLEADIPPEAQQLRIFWGRWILDVEPFDRSSGYPNIQRALSAQELRWSFESVLQE